MGDWKGLGSRDLRDVWEGDHSAPDQAPPLASRIRGVDEFLNAIAGSPARCAMLVIDIQDAYCLGVAQPVRDVSRRIHDYTPAFREAGISIYQVVMDSEYVSGEEPDLYQLRPEQRDYRFEKNRESAFKGSDIAEKLAENGHDFLLICGIYLNACVQETYTDALSGEYGRFEVGVLTDLSSNQTGVSEADSRGLSRDMTWWRGHICESDWVLRRLGQPAP